MPRTFSGEYITEGAKLAHEADELWISGEYDDARKKFIKAIEAYEKNSDVEGECQILIELVEFELSIEHYGDAERTLRTLIKKSENNHDLSEVYGKALLLNADIMADTATFEEALGAIKKAEVFLANNCFDDCLAKAKEKMGRIYLKAGKGTEAINYLIEAAKLYQHKKDYAREAVCKRATAQLYIQRKEPDKAHELLEDCVVLYRGLGDLIGEAASIFAIGMLRLGINDILNARKALQKSIFLYNKAGFFEGEADASVNLARAECSANGGDRERAIYHYTRAVKLYELMHNEAMRQKAQEELSRIS